MADYSVTSESENLRLQMRRMMDGLHVAMPAKVLAFQPGPPVRVTVQPTTQMKITLGEEVSYRSLPQLSGVPVVLPFAQTAGFLLTVPIQPGDTGLLVIPDRGLDNFLQAGDVSTRAALTPIRAKRIPHTMGNTMPGGESGGCTMVCSYCAAPSRVSQPDRAPTASTNKIHSP